MTNKVVKWCKYIRRERAIPILLLSLILDDAGEKCGRGTTRYSTSCGNPSGTFARLNVRTKTLVKRLGYTCYGDERFVYVLSRNVRVMMICKPFELKR